MVYSTSFLWCWPPVGTLVRLSRTDKESRVTLCDFGIVTSDPKPARPTAATEVTLQRLPFREDDSPLRVALGKLRPHKLDPRLDGLLHRRYIDAVMLRAQLHKLDNPIQVVAETDSLLRYARPSPRQLAALLIPRAVALRGTPYRSYEAVSSLRRVIAPPLSRHAPGLVPDALAELAITYTRAENFDVAVDTLQCLHTLADRPGIAAAFAADSRVTATDLNSLVRNATETVLLDALEKGNSTGEPEPRCAARRAAKLMLEVSPDHSVALLLISEVVPVSPPEHECGSAREPPASRDTSSAVPAAVKETVMGADGTADADKTNALTVPQYAVPNMAPGTLVYFTGLSGTHGARLNGGLGIVAGFPTDGGRVPVYTIETPDCAPTARGDNLILLVPSKLQPASAGRATRRQGKYLSHVIQFLRKKLQSIDTSSHDKACTAATSAHEAHDFILGGACSNGAEAAAPLRDEARPGAVSGSRPLQRDATGGSTDSASMGPWSRSVIAAALCGEGEIGPAVDELETLSRELPGGGADFSTSLANMCDDVVTLVVLGDDACKRRACEVMLRLQPDHELAAQTLRKMDD